MSLMVIILIILLGFLFLRKRKNDKRMINNITEVKIISKKIIKEHNNLKLVPSTMSNDLSSAGTKISENFFVANDSEEKEKILYCLTIEATLENNRVITEDTYVSKKIYSDVVVDSYYPIGMFK